MEDLIQDIRDRTGLSTEKVLEVVTLVTDHMRSVLPEDLLTQVATYLGDATSKSSHVATDAVTTATDLASKAAGVAATAVSAALDAASDVLPKTDNE